MPNISVANKLVPALENGPVAGAENIAYSTTTEGSGYMEREVIDKSLKQKIDEIESYSEGVTVKQKISQIDSNVSQLNSDNIATAVTNATNAADRAENILGRQSDTLQDGTVYGVKNDIDASLNTINNLRSDIDTTMGLVRDLSTSFDPSAQIQVTSESNYNNLQNKDPNTVYLLYEG